MPLSVEEITNEARRRVSNDAQRIRIYDRCRDGYFGRANPQQGFRAMDNTGRPLDRAESLRRGVSTVGAPNILQPLVDDFVSLKGQVPVMSVVPEDDSKESKDISIKRSRILRSQWEHSRMVLQMREAAFHLSCMGDACFVLDPLFPSKDGSMKDPIFEGGLKPPGVYITVVDPRLCYPQFRTGVDRFELDSLVITWRTDYSTAKTKWPKLSHQSDGSEVVIVQYFDREGKHTIVDGQQVEYIKHGLSFCPAQWVVNKATGEQNQADIGQIIDQHEEYQVMTRVANDALILAIYPITWIKNPLEFNDTLPIGPGALIPIGAEGSIGQLAPSALPQAAHELMSVTMRHMEQQAGSAPVRVDSSIEHSNISSRAIHAVQGPMESRLGSFQDILGFSMQMLNAKVLLMLWLLDEFKKPMSIFAKDKLGKETVTFSGEDLGGWWRTDIDWDVSAGGKHERIVQALQLHGQKIVPRTYVAEQAGIADPEQSISEADAEAAALAGPLQGEQGGPPPGGPDAAGAMQQQIAGPADQALAGLGGGQMQPPPGAQGPGPEVGPQPLPGPGFSPVDTPPSQPGIGSPAPLNDPFQMIQELLAPLLDRLSGGQPTVTVSKGKLVVQVNLWKDVSIVRKALKPLGDAVRVEVKQAA